MVDKKSAEKDMKKNNAKNVEFAEELNAGNKNNNNKNNNNKTK